MTASAPGRKLISIVTPCYNEELNVDAHFERVSRAIAPLRERYDFEHIYMDNRSKDRTFEKLRSLAKREPGVKALRFSRNLGSTRSMLIGLEHAKGDAAILIQADLQDPPELIPDFVRGWEEGYDVVYGQITNRKAEGFVLQRCRRLYYWIIDRFSDVPIPRNAGDFRITSRRVLDALAGYREDELYLRGIIAHIGFEQKALPYERMPRERGESNAPVLYLFAFALSALLSTTVVPIRLVTILGLLTSAGGALLAAYFVVCKIALPQYVPTGITTVAVLVALFAGLQLLALGIIGEYIRKIYLQSLGRPRGFVSDRVGF
jgi:polyisoprenyl-phosphate glycosyltransferase